MRASEGYTLVELLVALAVTVVLVGGIYAAYGFISQQQQVLLNKTSLNRSALRAIELLQMDIRMAGYLDFSDVNAMQPNQPVVINSTNPADINIVYDDFDSSGNLYRALIHYYLSLYTPSTGPSRNRLLRDWRICNNPSAYCSISNSTSLTPSGLGEPVSDWVSSFTVQGMNPKATGTYAGQYQILKINLTLLSPNTVESIGATTTKSFTFMGVAKNVLLVP